MKSNDIIIIANFNSPAVLHALRLHIIYIEGAGYKPILCTNTASNKTELSKYFDLEIVIYSNYFSFFRFLLNSNARYIYCIDIFSVIYISVSRLFGKKILFWVQGISPEESYLKHKNILRKIVLDIIEYAALLLSNKYIFVSGSMHDFLKRKYRINFKQYKIVPCNSEFKYVSTHNRVKDSFVYLGGLSAWQRFGDVIEIFTIIQEKRPNAILHIITHDLKEATDQINKIPNIKEKISIYSLTDRNSIPKTLSKFEYGFLLRQESPVNHVSSPIKFAEYLSCGVNLIMTNAIPHYSKLVLNNGIGIVIDSPSQFDTTSLKPNPEKAIEIYNEYFSDKNNTRKFKSLIEND